MCLLHPRTRRRFCDHSVSFCEQDNAETDVYQTWPALARDDPPELMNLWWWSRSACGSLFHFLHCCGIGNIWTFLIRSTTDFAILGEMTDADKVMHPQHFGTDPADIQIWINTVWNPRWLLVEILALAEVCNLWVLLLAFAIVKGKGKECRTARLGTSLMCVVLVLGLFH